MKALLIDIGNSRVKARRIDLRADSHVDFAAIPTDRLERLSELWPRPDPAVGPVCDVAFISNVARSDAEVSVVRWLSESAPASHVERITPEPLTAGVINGYRDAAKLGPDRWMALVGAHALMPERSLLVCSFGTATTLDLLQYDGERREATFVGGVILPGVDAMRAALSERTARLGVREGIAVDFADNTEDAITSGVMLAQTGALHETWNRARHRVSGRLECIFAGGASPSFVDAFGRPDIAVHHVPDLVIRGLAVVARRWCESMHAYARPAQSLSDA